jgi:predicted PurR-regulated permease PerM
VRTLGILCGIVVLLAALKAAASIVVPLLLGATIAVAFAPTAERLERRGLPPIASAGVTIVAVLAVVGAMGAIMVAAAGDLAESLPEYQAQLVAARQGVLHWLQARDLGEVAASVQQINPAKSAGAMVTSTLISAGDVLSDGFIVLLIAVFIQLEATTIKDKLRIALGSAQPVEQTLNAIGEVQRYLIVKTALSAANGVLLGFWCYLWGLSNPVLWGVLAFALNFVPIVGSLISAVIPVALALVELGVGSAIGVAVGYGLVNLLVDNALEPRLMGRALGLSPLVLLLSMLIWGYVLGPVGALLSVPLTVAVRIFLDYHENLRWIALLMASGPAARQARRDHLKRLTVPSS